MKKPSMAVPLSAAAGVCPDPSLSSGCPLVTEHLVSCVYDDNTSRERSTISLWIEESKVKMALNDKNVKRSLYRSADTILEAIEALEEALQEAERPADWRPWKKSK